MVSSTQGPDVLGAGGAAVRVGDDVVLVAASGWPGAPGEQARVVAQGGLFGEPLRDLVALDRDVLGQVDHRLHDHRGLGVGAPAADLVGGDHRAVVLHPGQVQAVTGAAAGDGGFGEVHVEDQLPRLGALPR